MVSCHEGEPHQIATGHPLNTSHSCSSRSLSDILLPCLVSPAHTLRSYLRWSCAVCNMTYRGTTASCNKETCQTKAKEFTSYIGMAKRFAEVMATVASITGPMFTPQG